MRATKVWFCFAERASHKRHVASRWRAPLHSTDFSMSAPLKPIVQEFWPAEFARKVAEGSKGADPAEFREAFRAKIGGCHDLALTGSGREALQIALRIMRDGTARDKVLVCNFNCSVVPAAVKRAGLRVDTFDLSSVVGDIDWTEVAGRLTTEHLCIVVPHFFGIPTDFRPLVETARSKGVFVLEDCAHTLGAKIGDAFAGTLGDAAIFSFNDDKPISLCGGGVLSINNPTLRIDRAKIERQPDVAAERKQVLRQIAHLQLTRAYRTRPGLLPRVATKLGLSPFAQQTTIGIGRIRAALGLWQLERYAAVSACRNDHAAKFEANFPESCWRVPPGTSPAHLRLRMFLGEASAEKIVAAARVANIRVGNFNWSKVVADTGGAISGRAAQSGLDIPIHQGLTAGDMHALIAILKDAGLR
jgi:dTDP-4-amino-4,6-dideoxygalactose transaminase